MFQVGDIVQWDGVGTSKEHKRVVEVWCKDEPKQLLVTDVDGDTMKTVPALAADCVLIERREPPKRIASPFKPIEKADPRNHKIAEDR